MLLLVDKTKLEANQTLSHVFTIRPYLLFYQHIVKGISSDESSHQSLSLYGDGNQIAPLPFHEWLLIVVTFATNRTESLLNTLVALEFFKVCEACSMIYMTTT